jgi:eukaryotic-like serine/threonine-protein kinase
MSEGRPAGRRSSPGRPRLAALSADDTADVQLEDTLPAADVTSAAQRPAPLALEGRYDGFLLLGEGAVGRVYRARDVRLGRAVAIKVSKRDAPADRRRLLEEASTQARLDHANVCHVYEAGEAGGRPFIAMQLVLGGPLSRSHRSLTVREKMEIMREIAGAAHELHRIGLLHCDIKPGNILVERRPDGLLKPYIVDFGLAQEAARGPRSVVSVPLGTPAYMAPEQAAGDRRALDPRSDVYGLGATLFDLCAGRPPYVGDHPWQIVDRILTEDPPSLQALATRVPAALARLVMKCLERDPARRYGSARDVADDLQRLLGGAPIRRGPSVRLVTAIADGEPAIEGDTTGSD